MAYCCWIGVLDLYIRDLLRTTEPGLAFAGRLLFFSFALWHVTSVILVAIFFLYLFFAWGMQQPWVRFVKWTGKLHVVEHYTQAYSIEVILGSQLHKSRVYMCVCVGYPARRKLSRLV